MREFEWLETFELRVPEIDGDHRAMLDLMKAVRSVAQANDRRRCERYLDRLFAHSRSHFEREEAFIRRWGYPRVDTHADYHAQLLQRAESVRTACTAIESPEEFEKCCDELMSFLIDDVVRGDMRLKSFLQDAGLTLPV